MKSPVWGNQDYPVSQAFGVNLPSVPDEWYAYATQWGLDYGDHAGIDVGVPKYTPIYAVAGGTVDPQTGFSPYFRPYPAHVVTEDSPNIPGDDREEHIYGHLWQLAEGVRPGTRVRAGQLLGYSGEQTVAGTMQPDGSGPHLHFERRSLARHVVLDPSPLLTGTAVLPDGTIVTQLPNTGSGSLSGIVDKIAGAAGRVGLGIGGIVLLGLGAVILFPGIANVTPIGRAVNIARKLK